MKRTLFILLLVTGFIYSKQAHAYEIQTISPLRFPSGFAGINDVIIVAPFDRGSAVFRIIGGEPLSPIYYAVVEQAPQVCYEDGCAAVAVFTYGGPKTLDSRGEAIISVGAKVTTPSHLRGGTYSGELTLAVSGTELVSKK